MPPSGVGRQSRRPAYHRGERGPRYRSSPTPLPLACYYSSAYIHVVPSRLLHVVTAVGGRRHSHRCPAYLLLLLDTARGPTTHRSFHAVALVSAPPPSGRVSASFREREGNAGGLFSTCDPGFRPPSLPLLPLLCSNATLFFSLSRPSLLRRVKKISRSFLSMVF